MGKIMAAEYRRLLELNRELNEELKKGSYDLEKLLSESSLLMQSIDKQSPPQDETQLQEIYQILAQLVELQKENQELIQKRMTELSEELTQTQKGKEAQRAYHQKKRGSQFLDQFK